jgi:hypothetical protein
MSYDRSEELQQGAELFRDAAPRFRTRQTNVPDHYRFSSVLENPFPGQSGYAEKDYERMKYGLQTPNGAPDANIQQRALLNTPRPTIYAKDYSNG